MLVNKTGVKQMSGGVAVFLLAYLGSLIWCTVIGVQKGKGAMMVCGWILFTPLIYIGASRIAKPNSKWAREKYHYDPMKSELSKMRFPKERWIMENAQWMADQRSVVGQPTD